MTELTTEPNSEPALQENQASRQSPGALIHEARMRLEYSLDDLAHETRLFKSTLHQLECDEYRDLPQPPLAAGYYRQCARALGLDEDKIADACREHVGAVIAPQVRHMGSAAGIAPTDVTPRGPRRLPRLLLLLLLLVALAVAGVALLLPSLSLPGGDTGANEDGKTVLSINEPVSAIESSSEAMSAATPTEDAGNSGASQIPAATGSSSSRRSTSPHPSNKANTKSSRDIDRVAQSGKATDTDGPQTAGDGAADDNDSQREPFITPAIGGRKVAAIFGNPNSMVATALAAKRLREAETGGSNKTPSVPPNRLKLQFDEKCWVRLTDANGNRLFMGVFQAGDSRVFEATLPYHLTLGYAPGAKVSIGGQPVDIDKKTDDGVAHLTITAPENASTYG